MGQYHYLINFTKREFVYPPTLDTGLKMMEQMETRNEGTLKDALYWLLIGAPECRGGGDYVIESYSTAGRWAGDRVAIIGDYARDSDLGEDQPDPELSTAYVRCIPEYAEDTMSEEDQNELLEDPNPLYSDISGLVRKDFERLFDWPNVEEDEAGKGGDRLPPLTDSEIANVLGIIKFIGTYSDDSELLEAANNLAKITQNKYNKDRTFKISSETIPDWGSASDKLTGSFTWCKTKQGHSYWVRIRDKMVMKSEQEDAA